MERGVGYGFDSADRITFKIDDESDMGSSNFFLVVLIMENYWFCC